MSHETRDDFNGLACIVEQFKGHVIGFLREQTLDFHRSFAPLYGTPVLKYEQMLSLDYKCLHNRMDTEFAQFRIFLKVLHLGHNRQRHLLRGERRMGLVGQAASSLLYPTTQGSLHGLGADAEISRNAFDRPAFKMQLNDRVASLFRILFLASARKPTRWLSGRRIGIQDMLDDSRIARALKANSANHRNLMSDEGGILRFQPQDFLSHFEGETTVIHRIIRRIRH